ncbi:MAG: GGDEF domain-containing protein [Lachnospiraceae bacterium]|nr:GGDEF domain-containing protein [Lachnospiraceae bacterium]
MKKDTVNLKRIINYLNTNKYYYVTVLIGLIHVGFFIFFLKFKVWPMVIFNVISPILYFSSLRLIRQGKLLAMFLFDYIEISVHAIMASICVGWGFDFEQYIFTLVPYGYFICYELFKGKKRYIIASVLGLVDAVASLIVRYYTYSHEPLYKTPERLAFLFNQFNLIVAYVALFFFLIMFMFELYVMEAKMEAENAVLNHDASVDPLTTLLNRRSMKTHLEEAYNKKEPFSVAMIDLDDFKSINDSYGHDAGDLVLKEMTRIVKSCVPEGNPICRWGGEEILILFNGMDKDEATGICEEIREKMERNEINFFNKKLKITMTIGVAPHRMAYSIDETIAEADEKMYYGKEKGKNLVISNLNGL